MAQRVAFGTGREEALKAWLDREIQQALTARQPLERQWLRWLEQYRAPANRPLKHFPFEGAANFELPLTAIDVDTLFAKFVQTIHAPSNLWTLEPLNPDWDDAAKPLQDFLEWLDGAILKTETVNKRAILELTKLGTCIYKTGWLFERRPVTVYDDTGTRQRIERMRSRPLVDHVRLSDFLLPPYAYNIDPDAQGGAPWVAERFRRPIDHLESIADASEPYLPDYGIAAVKKLRQFVTRSQTDYDDKVQDLDYSKTPRTAAPQSFDMSSEVDGNTGKAGSVPTVEDLEWWQIHCRFATQSAGGSQDDIVVEYHVPTRMFMRAIYQPYRHGKRPYSVARYFPGEGFYGIGVCEQKEMFQRSESDLFNYGHDGALLSNAMCLAVKQGSNIGPGEPIWPGRVLVTDGNPREELMAFQLGTAYPNLMQIQSQVATLGERRTGVSDLQQGNISALPSRTPATSVTQLLEEGSRRPDLTLHDLRDCLGEVGLRVLQLLQQYVSQPGLGAGGEVYVELIERVLGAENAAKVLKKLELDPETIEMGFGVTLTATSSSANKELSKQNLMGLVQLQMQIAPAVTQLLTQAMQMPGTPVGQAALDLAQGIAYLQQRLLEQSDIRNVKALVPQIPVDPQPALPGFPGAAGGAPLQLLGGGGGAPPGAPGAPGLETLFGVAGAGGPGGV